MDKEKIDELFNKLESNKLDESCDNMLKEKLQVCMLEDEIIKHFEKSTNNIIFVKNKKYNSKVISEACNNDYFSVGDLYNDKELIVVRPTIKQKILCFFYAKKCFNIIVLLIFSVLLFINSIRVEEVKYLLSSYFVIVIIIIYGCAYNEERLISKLKEC